MANTFVKAGGQGFILEDIVSYKRSPMHYDSHLDIHYKEAISIWTKDKHYHHVEGDLTTIDDIEKLIVDAMAKTMNIISFEGLS